MVSRPQVGAGAVIFYAVQQRVPGRDQVEDLLAGICSGRQIELGCQQITGNLVSRVVGAFFIWRVEIPMVEDENT